MNKKKKKKYVNCTRYSIIKYTSILIEREREREIVVERERERRGKRKSERKRKNK